MTTTEYWLQKKTIGGWSMVTWYDSFEQASINYDKLIKGEGYSYRLVKVEMIREHMLDEVTKVDAPEYDDTFAKLNNKIEAKSNVWAGQKINNQDPHSPVWGKSVQDAPKSSGWGHGSGGWNKPAVINPIKDTGLSGADGRGAKAGSVCLMHHGLKKRMRAMPEELDMLLSQGWERGGPRTQFK